MTGIIFDIKEMAVHDGPGIRTTVFLKGCPLRCLWCHNPEGLSSVPQLFHKKARCSSCNACKRVCNHPECKPFGKCVYICPENCLEITGREITASDLGKELKASAEILKDNFGGFTFSGGEPLAQPGFLLELFHELKEYHLCVETSGYCNSEVFEDVINKLDLIIMDFKLADPKLHLKYTGVDNQLILNNFKILRDSKKPYIIRTPLVPGITDTKENLEAIRQIIGDSIWEKLPFNNAAATKYSMLNMEYSF